MPKSPSIAGLLLLTILNVSLWCFANSAGPVHGGESGLIAVTPSHWMPTPVNRPDEPLAILDSLGDSDIDEEEESSEVDPILSIETLPARDLISFLSLLAFENREFRNRLPMTYSVHNLRC